MTSKNYTRTHNFCLCAVSKQFVFCERLTKIYLMYHFHTSFKIRLPHILPLKWTEIT